jgi:hypothetical protein
VQRRDLGDQLFAVGGDGFHLVDILPVLQCKTGETEPRW